MKTISGSFVLLCLAALCVMLDACQPQSSRFIRHSDYLYEAWVEDYVLDSLVAHHTPTSLAVGCSQVRKGEFVGRNLDWYVNREVTVLVHVRAGEGRYASLGVASCSPDFTVDNISQGEIDDKLQFLPLCVVDGVNEKGVYVGVNNVPTGETSFDSTLWNYPMSGLGAVLTNPQSEKTYADFYVVRYVLDRAASVREAIELLREINWFEPEKVPHSGKTQSLHWLIADERETAVVEFIDNQLHYIISDVPNEASFATLMTNFNNVLRKEGMMQYHACGYERFDILHANYAHLAHTRAAMQELMKKVWYSQVYTQSVDSPSFFFSEYYGASSPINRDYTSLDLYQSHSIRQDSFFRQIVEEAGRNFVDTSLWHCENSPLWYTNHTVVYDLCKKDLTILLHEGLDGMKEWYFARL